MKNRKWLVIIIGAITGGVAGYLYWESVGFDARSPLISTVTTSICFGAVLVGSLIAILNSSRQIET